MKRILFSLGCVLSLNGMAQESQFLGNFTPQISHLVPAKADMEVSKTQVIKPNFKGRDLIEVDNSNTHNPDWVWQQHETQSAKTPTATILWSKPGLGVGISPPDPSGDADSSVVIAAMNSSGGAVYRIYNRSTGATVGSTSYTMKNLVSSGQVTGAGDPIVLYYKPARRWFLTEFSSSGNRLIVYVSQTSNPQGTYYKYTFTCPNFPDYPKYGFSQSSDALIVSTNEGNPAIYAMRLSTMLTGATTSAIRTTVAKLNGFGFQSLTPVDLEGDNPAPTGMKPLFIRHRDDESHNASTANSTQDLLELWELNINWTASSMTCTKIQDIAIAEIDSKLCGLTSFACIKQPGTTNTLDPLREPCMFKAPMRVFDDRQTIVVCLSTDVDGADRAGIRWVELRRAPGVTTATWTKYQEGTYAPGTGTSRWMPSINIDKNGNILMAYSTASGTTGDFPSIKMTGRKACDPLGTMTMAETTIIAGANSKTTSGDTRWGDYHHMAMDDFDGVTFYYSGVYQSGANSAGGTKTNVAAIRFNPDARDASIVNIIPDNSGGSCGSSSQIGVVIENAGSNAITSGSFTWQVGNGTATTQNYTTTSLTTTGSIDTIYVTVTGLTTGSNTITINSLTVNGQGTDDNTCNDTKSVVITAGSGSSFNVNNTINAQPTCTSSNGSVTLSATNGTAPYTYAVNNGTPQSNATFTSLAAGNYTYQITDATGCTVSGTFSLVATGNVVASAQLTTAIPCNAGTATVTVSGTGGQSAYTYSSNGTNYQSSATFSGLAAGSYTFYAKDANGCIGQTTLTITQPTVLNLNVVPTMVTCNGANDGKLVGNATGGTSPYTYSIDGTNFYSQNTINALAPGSYTVTVKDANGCTKTFNSTITQPTQVNVTGVATASTGNNGTISLSGSGGLTPYTYSINGTNYGSAALFSNLAPGTYTCYIKDANGCIQSTSVIVESTIGINEIEGASFLVELFPNPNNGIFDLKVTNVSGESVECRLFNLAGQEVANFKMEVVNGTASKTFEMSKKLAAGSYLLGVYSNEKAVIKKVVKQ